PGRVTSPGTAAGIGAYSDLGRRLAVVPAAGCSESGVPDIPGSGPGAARFLSPVSPKYPLQIETWHLPAMITKDLHAYSMLSLHQEKDFRDHDGQQPFLASPVGARACCRPSLSNAA